MMTINLVDVRHERLLTVLRDHVDCLRHGLSEAHSPGEVHDLEACAKEVEQLIIECSTRHQETVLYLAAEFGFRARERNINLEAMRAQLAVVVGS